MSIDAATFLESVTFEAPSLGEVPFDALRATLRARSIVRVRGLLPRTALRDKLTAIRARFDPRCDAKHDPRDTEATRRNFQKLQVGAGSGVGTRRTLGRFLRILYNPIFAEDLYDLREDFVTLARFRNGLYGLPGDRAIFGTDDGLWTCARLHQYPRGGGFMVPHQDVFSQMVTAEKDLGYYQAFFLLSEQGLDYEEGGAYIDLEGERVHYEPYCHAGDLVVYDGRTVHGVADIDPLQPLELDRFGGRVAAFASLFRHLGTGSDSYEALSRRATAHLGLGDGEGCGDGRGLDGEPRARAADAGGDAQGAVAEKS